MFHARSSFKTIFYQLLFLNLTAAAVDTTFMLGVMQAGPQTEQSKAHDQVNTAQTVQMVKPLGVQAIEFAADWRAIQPANKDEFDVAALEKLAHKCATLKAAGYKQVLILDHYTKPDWFYEIDGFEKEANIQYFVAYAQKVFEYVGDKVEYIVTIHQPAGYALERYYRGVYFPGKRSMQLALEVLKNQLEAHVAAYNAIKALPHGADVQIGIAHQILPIEPFRRMNPLDQLGAAIANKLNNRLVIEYFKSGKLSFMIPSLAGSKFYFVAYMNHVNAQAPKCLDFIGINYLSHMYINNFKPVVNEKEESTDVDIFRIYPQGLFQAIRMAAQLDLPIHILGNGIADAQDTKRENFIKQHLAMVEKAIEQGYDVRSYFYRSLEDVADDAYKWGLYEVNPKTMERTLRTSAQALIGLN